MQLWVAWLHRENVSRGIISDIDLQVLVECSVSLSLVPAMARVVLHDARTLWRKYEFMASVELWAKALRDAECAALIPVVCQVYYHYQVSVRVSGMSVGELYEELRRAIVHQPVPTSVQPLDWTFSTIVSGYNAHPVFHELYDFQVAVSQGSLNHGRRVLLSIMCLLASRTQSDLDHWQAAYESLLFPDGVVLLDCAGCNKTYLLSILMRCLARA
jgi:phosphoribosyl-ATP pyrophosphohydrolase